MNFRHLATKNNFIEIAIIFLKKGCHEANQAKAEFITNNMNRQKYMSSGLENKGYFVNLNIFTILERIKEFIKEFRFHLNVYFVETFEIM